MTKIYQTNSKNSIIRNGIDWNGKKISKKLIEHCLKLENWIEENPNYIIDDSWSDYQPGYIISGVRKNPINPNGNDGIRLNSWKNKYYPILEIFPRVIGVEGFYLRDSRILSPQFESGKLFSNKFYSFEELIKEIKRTDYGIDVSEYIRFKDLKGFTFGNLTSKDIEEVKSLIL